MKQQLVRESYLYPALEALLINLRGTYSNWEFTIKKKDDTMDYHQLYAKVKNENKYPNLNIDGHFNKLEFDNMQHFAHTWVAGFEWGYQEAEENKGN